MKLKISLITAISLSIITLNVFADSSETRTDNISGLEGETLRIKTFHSFVVNNESNQMKNYIVAETCKANGKEYKKGWGFSLSPHQTKKFSENLYLEYQTNEKGIWKIESMTCVTNSKACSFDHADLIVK